MGSFDLFVRESVVPTENVYTDIMIFYVYYKKRGGTLNSLRFLYLQVNNMNIWGNLFKFCYINLIARLNCSHL